MSPVPRHRCYYEGATTSHSRRPASLWFRSQAPHAPPSFVIAKALPSCAEDASRAWNHGQPGFPIPAFSPVGASGISQVPWSSLLCLCPVPRPRRSRQDLVCVGPTSAAPGPNRPKALSHHMISGLPQGFSIRCLRFTNDVAVAHARLTSGWRTAPLPGGGRTLWMTSKGFRFYTPFSFPGLALTQAGSTQSDCCTS